MKSFQVFASGLAQLPINWEFMPISIHSVKSLVVALRLVLSQDRNVILIYLRWSKSFKAEHFPEIRSQWLQVLQHLKYCKTSRYTNLWIKKACIWINCIEIALS